MSIIDQSAFPFDVIFIDGVTCCGKTTFIDQLNNKKNANILVRNLLHNADRQLLLDFDFYCKNYQRPILTSKHYMYGTHITIKRYNEDLKSKLISNYIDICNLILDRTIMALTYAGRTVIVDRSPFAILYFQTYKLMNVLKNKKDRDYVFEEMLAYIKRLSGYIKASTIENKIGLSIFTNGTYLPEKSFEDLSDENLSRVTKGHKEIKAVYVYTPSDLKKQDSYFRFLKAVIKQEIELTPSLFGTAYKWHFTTTSRFLTKSFIEPLHDLCRMIEYIDHSEIYGLITKHQSKKKNKNDQL